MNQSLTPDRLRELLHYDPETGAFTWRVNRPPRAKAGDSPRSPTRAGYFRASIDGRLHYLHRLAWLYVFGEWPCGSVDHINGDVQDNRISNLRDVSHSTNLQNLRSARADNKLGLLGVHVRRDTGRYSASIYVNKRHVSLGCFDCPVEAHEAYIIAKRKHHEGCTL